MGMNTVKPPIKTTCGVPSRGEAPSEFSLEFSLDSSSGFAATAKTPTIGIKIRSWYMEPFNTTAMVVMMAVAAERVPIITIGHVDDFQSSGKITSKSHDRK